MSRRPGQWDLLGYSSDPIPGDVHEVHQQAKKYKDVAADIDHQITRLKQIAEGEDGQSGKFLKPLRSSAEELAGELSKVQNRFDTVSTQLDTWAETLDHGRARSATLLSNAVDAQQAIGQNTSTGPLPADATQEQKDADGKRADRHGAAVTHLAHYVKKMGELMNGGGDEVGVNVVAKHVANAIKHASDDKVKDSWWDRHVRKWIHEHAGLIMAIIKVIAIVAVVIAVVALVLATGGFGLLALAGVAAETLSAMAAVASVLETAGAVLSVLMLVGHGALKANGEDVSWVDLGLDVLSVATFGAAGALSKAAKPLIEGAESGARATAGLKAIEALPQNVKNALKIINPANNLARWAARMRVSAVESAVSGVDTALEAAPSALKTVLLGSAKEAQELQKLHYLATTPEVANIAAKALRLKHIQAAVGGLEHIKLGGWEIPHLPHEISETAHVLTHKSEWYGAGE